MTRSLFFAVFLRLTFAMAVVALLQLAFGRRVWIPLLFVVPVLAALTAKWTARSVRRSLSPLERSAATLVELRQSPSLSTLRDFDGLTQALATASVGVEKALAQSAESRHELEALLDSMQDAVVAVDAAGRIQWTNQRMQRLMPGTTVSSSVRIGHALVQTIRDPDVLQCVRTALEERLISERRSTSLLPGRIFEVSASPMPDGGAVAVLHDITRIEEIERTQREFVANVSHELRTPLTSISGYVETLLDHEAALSLQAREFLTTILKNATRMSRLTEDLLMMARVESTEQELHPAPVRADTLVADAVQAMSGLVQDNDAVLEIGAVTTCQVFADTDAVLQVLSNLIENAVKYGQSRGQSQCRVIVAAREIDRPHPAVEFSVRDFGQGIASEHLSRIFERFYRVDKARSRDSGGTGLGLAIAQHIIHAQGGTIRAESEMNAGSTFLFTLPKALYPIT